MMELIRIFAPRNGFKFSFRRKCNPRWPTRECIHGNGEVRQCYTSFGAPENNTTPTLGYTILAGLQQSISDLISGNEL